MSRLPTVRPTQVARALERAGFARRRQSGSHLSMRHSEGRLCIVPIHPRDLKREVLKTILKQAGLSEDEFLKLL